MGAIITSPSDGPATLDQREEAGEGAGWTVWKHNGAIGTPWRAAWSGQDSYTAGQVYDRLVRRSSWGAVRLLDPYGRDVRYHFGRGYGSG